MRLLTSGWWVDPTQQSTLSRCLTWVNYYQSVLVHLGQLCHLRGGQGRDRPGQRLNITMKTDQCPHPHVWLGLVICKTFVIQDTWTAFHLGEGEDNDGNNNAPTYFKCCWEHRQANKIRAINEGMEVLYLNTSLHPPHTWCQSWQITRGWQNNNNIRLQIFSFFLLYISPHYQEKIGNLSVGENYFQRTFCKELDVVYWSYYWCWDLDSNLSPPSYFK